MSAPSHEPAATCADETHGTVVGSPDTTQRLVASPLDVTDQQANAEDNDCSSPVPSPSKETAARPADPMALGQDNFLHVASMIDLTTLISASQVCRAWRAALFSTSNPWRRACIDAGADEGDRVEAVAETIVNGVMEQVHKWRELCLMYARTEIAWDLGCVRSSMRRLPFRTYSHSTLTPDLRNGILSVQGLSEDTDNRDVAFLDRKTLQCIGRCRASDYPNITIVTEFATTYDDNNVDVLISKIQRTKTRASDQPPTVVSASLVPLVTVTVPPQSEFYLVFFRSPDGSVSPAFKTTEEGSTRIYQSPFGTGAEIGINCMVVHHIALLSPKCLAYFDDRFGVTLTHSRFHNSTQLSARFPPPTGVPTPTAGLSFRLRLGRYFKPVDHTTKWQPDTGVLDISGLLPTDRGFESTFKHMGDDDEDPRGCFNGSELFWMKNRILLILRHYAQVFEDVVDMSVEARNSYIARHTIALRFSASIRSLRFHNWRFAVLTDDRHVVIFDSRKLPSMPPPPPSARRPRLRALVLTGAFPSHQELGLPAECHPEIEIDSRAVYLFDGGAQTLVTHEFDR